MMMMIKFGSVYFSINTPIVIFFIAVFLPFVVAEESTLFEPC